MFDNKFKSNNQRQKLKHLTVLTVKCLTNCQKKKKVNEKYIQIYRISGHVEATIFKTGISPLLNKIQLREKLNTVEQCKKKKTAINNIIKIG